MTSFVITSLEYDFCPIDVVEFNYSRYCVAFKRFFDHLHVSDSNYYLIFIFMDDFYMVVIHPMKSCFFLVYSVSVLRFLEVFIAFFPR
ncbi:hypothetical protein B2G88_12215 [Natronolimnobius baerhuensis]|uniref:Uncharacterized protein n=1 Tax=Natronolimnobius baerhuensis TaxID=253108 RepID=A0A202EA57_9EURY|nr:hypothetical protein B2G88_12215 [Natronolimnobius baerhuensis]